MGMPEIKVLFESLASSAWRRSSKGIVALVISDTTSKNSSYEFKKFTDINSEDFTEENYDNLKLAFLGNPSKVIVEVLKSPEVLSAALNRLSYKKFDYLAVPSITTDETESVKTYILQQRAIRKIYKAVLPNTSADDESIINFTTTGIKAYGKSFTTGQYCCRIAGLLAGLPMTMSCTYYVLPEVEEIKEHSDPDTDIDAGKLILVNDGEKIKIGRGVNSLVTTTKTKNIEFKKIKIVETLDMIKQDIIKTFEDEYVGKISNTYDNKTLFLSNVNTTYLRNLQREGILDHDADAYLEINLDAHIKYLEDKGINTDDMAEMQIKKANTGSNVFTKGKVTPVDAMEDLDCIFYM